MTIFDVILLILLGGFTLFGAWFGFIHTLGSLVGSFVGTFVAGLIYIYGGTWLTQVFGHENLMNIISFIVIFIVINRLVGFGFYALEKMLRILTRAPFLKSIDKLLGVVVGFVEGILVIGISLFVISRYPLAAWFTAALKGSAIAPWFVKTSSLLQPLLPELLRNLQSIILG